MCADAYGGQKNVLDHLELELQAIVFFPMWFLGSELGSSARALSCLSSPKLYFLSKKQDLRSRPAPDFILFKAGLFV